MKSSRWTTRSSSSASASSAGVSARIMRRTTGRRSSPRNMCSVRHRPIPSAPSLRALAASSPVSALARTASLPLRMTSAHDSTVSKAAGGLAAVSGTSPATTMPAPPSRETQSPSTSVMPLAVTWRSPRRRTSAPTTAGLPQPRATTAAWLTKPPRAVRMPSEASMPCTSSGEVSLRTSTTGSPRSAAAAASLAVK